MGQDELKKTTTQEEQALINLIHIQEVFWTMTHDKAVILASMGFPLKYFVFSNPIRKS